MMQSWISDKFNKVLKMVGIEDKTPDDIKKEKNKEADDKRISDLKDNGVINSHFFGKDTLDMKKIEKMYNNNKLSEHDIDLMKKDVSDEDKKKLSDFELKVSKKDNKPLEPVKKTLKDIIAVRKPVNNEQYVDTDSTKQYKSAKFNDKKNAQEVSLKEIKNTPAKSENNISNTDNSKKVANNINHYPSIPLVTKKKRG